MEKLAFRPNPAFNPNNYEERGLHTMSGTVLVDLQEKRLAEFSGMLTKQVDFGFGLIGHLGKGGTIQVSRVRLSPDYGRQAPLGSIWTVVSFSSQPLASSRTRLTATSNRISTEHALRELISK
jgi:hypothetical protein